MSWRQTVKIRAWAALNVPLLFFCGPRIVSLGRERCEVKIPLRWRTKNHLGSMYFGVLAVGADCAGGLIAWEQIEASGGGVSLVFKDFQAEFLKRPEGDTHFVCEDGEKIRDLVKRARESGERVDTTVDVVARVPSKLPDSEPVARFKLTLSLKAKAKKA